MGIWIVSSLRLVLIALALILINKRTRIWGINPGVKSLDPTIYVGLAGSFQKKLDQFILTSTVYENSSCPKISAHLDLSVSVHIGAPVNVQLCLTVVLVWISLVTLEFGHVFTLCFSAIWDPLLRSAWLFGPSFYLLLFFFSLILRSSVDILYTSPCMDINYFPSLWLIFSFLKDVSLTVEKLEVKCGLIYPSFPEWEVSSVSCWGNLCLYLG